MREFATFFVPRHAQADGFIQRLDGRCFARQKPDIISPSVMTVTLQGIFTLGTGFGCAIFLVKTVDDHLVFRAGVECENSDGPHQSGDRHRTEHRTSVVRRKQDHRTPIENAAQRNLLAFLVPHHQIQRKILADALIEADLPDRGGQNARGRSGRLVGEDRTASGLHGLGRGAPNHERYDQENA